MMDKNRIAELKGEGEITLQRDRRVLAVGGMELINEIEHAPSVPHNAVCFFQDGDKMCAVFGDFVNLQESPAGFGADFEEAMNDLQEHKAAAVDRYQRS